jgi:hypothetical protein
MVVVGSHVERRAYFRGRGDETVGVDTRIGWICCGHGLVFAVVPSGVVIRLKAGLCGGEQIRHGMTQEAISNLRRRGGQACSARSQTVREVEEVVVGVEVQWLPESETETRCTQAL